MDNVKIFGHDLQGPASVHAETGALHVGSFEQSALLQGRFFAATYRQDAMAASAQYDILLKTGDRSCLAALAVTPSSAFEVKVYEAPTTTADGSSLPVGNLNRESDYAGTVVAFVGPTVSATGSLIFNPVAYAGGNKAPGVSTNPVQGIFARSTDYLIRVINTDGNDASIHTFISWAELLDESHRASSDENE